jgi:hypothetical protein
MRTLADPAARAGTLHKLSGTPCPLPTISTALVKVTLVRGGTIPEMILAVNPLSIPCSQTRHPFCLAHLQWLKISEVTMANPSFEEEN